MRKVDESDFRGQRPLARGGPAVRILSLHRRVGVSGALRGVVSTAASWNELDPVGALGRRTHPRLVNEALGRHIDRTSFAASRGVDVQRGLSPCRFSRQRNLVTDRLSVVGE